MNDAITLINVFTVPVEVSETFLEGWRERAHLIAAQPGFVQAKMYQAIHEDSELRFINVAEWSSEKCLQEALISTGIEASARQDVGRSDITSRPAVYRLAAHVVSAMDVTVHQTFLPYNDPDASLAFYRDALGLQVRDDVGDGRRRSITVGSADQPSTSIVLKPPAAEVGITDEEGRTIVEMMAKGTYASIVLSTADLDDAFQRLRANGAEVAQEPVEWPDGVRDCAVRDPAGNLIRIQERP